MCIKHLAYMVTQKIVPCKILFEMLILDLAIQRQSAKAECAKFTLATRTQDEWQRGTRERCPCWGPRAPGDSGGHGWDSGRWSRGDTWLSCETGTETSQSPQLYIASAAMVYKACSMGHRFPGRGKECHSETNFGKVAWDGSLLAESECASVGVRGARSGPAGPELCFTSAHLTFSQSADVFSLQHPSLTYLQQYEQICMHKIVRAWFLILETI